MFETLKNLWLNKKVISISNGFQVDPNDKSLNIGTIIDIIPITKNPAPIVLFENDKEPKLVFSTLVEFDSDL